MFGKREKNNEFDMQTEVYPDGNIWSITRNTDVTSWWELGERYRFRSWLCRNEA